MLKKIPMVSFTLYRLMAEKILQSINDKKIKPRGVTINAQSIFSLKSTFKISIIMPSWAKMHKAHQRIALCVFNKMHLINEDRKRIVNGRVIVKIELNVKPSDSVSM